MYKVVACDDNHEITNYLEKIVRENYFSDINIVTFQTSFSLLDYVFDTAKGNVDILLIDIDLGDDNGIDIAEQIKQRYPHIKVIFITGYIDYARDIFEAEPCFFLVKPIDEGRLIQALDKAVSLIKEDRQRCISIVSRGEIRNLQLSQIRYIENRNRTLIIREKNLDFEVHMKLGKFEEQLPENFVRCHQSYVVNLDHIRELTIDGANLYSGELVPVSRSKYADVKQAFLRYLGQKM
ncbi:MAG: response regulator transcription factor [Eubacterium sp.]|nr:response regulator transcription factor [Eubacterium sp.]